MSSVRAGGGLGRGLDLRVSVRLSGPRSPRRAAAERLAEVVPEARVRTLAQALVVARRRRLGGRPEAWLWESGG
ncbi:hypothetical protein OG618_36945 (plasmid) [Kitasatospora sp. NBC_01246]|uniref:hypothetical protein n=1 Tax=Kitasatospora sp. NBC_01246 TaxID=2903570 RepID=UPI002E3640D6|nr:hypothetical protein [Kitasatospora sp. NBC_01246]